MSVAPPELKRRSFLYRELAKLDAEFEEVNGTACAMTCGRDIEAETAQARDLAIADLSALARLGFKGRNTIGWLTERGVVVSTDDNMTERQADGTRAARLAPTEVLLLGDLGAESGLFGRLAGEWSPDPDPTTYPVPRADANCWFTLTGRHAAEMFAKLCGVDLRPHKFAHGAIAQTSIARLNAIVLRADLGEVLAYDMLTDIASASYMWASLRDAMDEFDGLPVGLGAIRRLAEIG